MAKFTKLNIGDIVASSGGRAWKKLSSMLQLSAPTLSLDGDMLTITDKSGLATSFDILVDGEVKGTATSATFDLSTLDLEEGTYSISVVAKADGYIDSAESEAVSYEVADDSIIGTWRINPTIQSAGLSTSYVSGQLSKAIGTFTTAYGGYSPTVRDLTGFVFGNDFLRLQYHRTTASSTYLKSDNRYNVAGQTFPLVCYYTDSSGSTPKQYQIGRSDANINFFTFTITDDSILAPDVIEGIKQWLTVNAIRIS